MATANTHRRLKICCVATSIFILILVIVMITIFFTILKPKKPQVTVHSTSLQHIEFKIFPKLSLNVTLGMVVTINNRNYGSFKYKNSTAYVNYRGLIVAEVPISSQLVRARSEFNISGSAELMAERLISSPYFLQDAETGVLGFTAVLNLNGKASLLKIFKFHAMARSSCDIFVDIHTHDIEAKCKSKLKL